MREGQGVLDRSAGASAEWLLTNGAGGSSYGTAAWIPAHRGHALLHVADLHGLVTTLLLGVEERAHVGGVRFDLGGWIDEGGLPVARLIEFRSDPWPTWRLECGGATLERSVLAVQDHQAVALAYRHLEGPPVHLRVSPLVVARPPDGLQRETPALRGVAHGIPGRVRVETLDGAPTLTLWHNGSFFPARLWRRGIAYASDRGRDLEDALVPGHVDTALEPGQSAHLVASSEDGLFRALAVEGRLGTPPPSTLSGCLEALAACEAARVQAFSRAGLKGADYTARQAAAAHGEDERARRMAPLVDAGDPWTLRLLAAVEQGLVRRQGRLTLISEYPGAEERPADALRATAGLISVRAFAEVKAILRGYLEYLDDGLLPDGFEPDGAPRYGAPEPSLWAIQAAELLARRSETFDWLKDGMFGQLESIMQFLRAGNRHGVRVGPDGLLEVGETEAARRPAALNALWYHALVAMAQLARLAGRRESAAFYLAWARQHGQSFNDVFWDESRGRLRDTVGPTGHEDSFSPAQILAASLAPPLLAPDRAQRLVETLERERFMPLGLLQDDGAALDPAWLGPFHAAYLRVHNRTREAQVRVRAWLDHLRSRLDEEGRRVVPARYEAPARRGARRAPPFPFEETRARGASPLAAAELLRLWIEDVAHGG